jgi:hypothetical protein
MTSIVRACPICDGHPDRGDGTMACWYCRVRPGHPYRVAGYVLSARPLSDFAPGEIAVDVYHCDRGLVAAISNLERAMEKHGGTR